MDTTFPITHNRDFLEHFLTRWRTLSISSEMIEKLKEQKGSDPYAAYGYGRWLSLVNPDGAGSIKEAEVLLTWAATTGNLPDAKAALAQMYYDGRIEADKSIPEFHAIAMNDAYKAGSELAQYLTLENTLYGEYGYTKNPALVADILQKHLEKSSGSDPIYYDLLGQALENTDRAAAEKAYLTSIERGNTESYYSLANFYRNDGDEKRACEIAGEGARKGAVNCHRFKAGMDDELFQELSDEEQEALHREIAEGLDYAIAHNDRYACFLKAALIYDGMLGFEKDPSSALEPLERGCAMGVANCYWLKAYIHHFDYDSLSPQQHISQEEFAKTCLQAARLGDREVFTLEQIARAYVAGSLPKHSEEIEKLWLDKYQEANPEEEDGKDSTGVVAVYPQGYYYCIDSEAGELNLDATAKFTGARSFDVVHYSTILARITKALGLDKESCHVVMLVDRDGYAKDLPDNMPGTIIYGHGDEMRGTVVFALEDDKSYTLMPMLGLQRVYMFLQMLDAATMGLVRQPSPQEQESIEAAAGVESEPELEPEPEPEPESESESEPEPESESEPDSDKTWDKLVIDVDYSPSDPGINNFFCERTPYERADVTAGRRLPYDDPGGLFGSIYVKEVDDSGVTLVYHEEEVTLNREKSVKKLDTGGRNYTNFYLHVYLQFPK